MDGFYLVKVKINGKSKVTIKVTVKVKGVLAADKGGRTQTGAKSKSKVVVYFLAHGFNFYLQFFVFGNFVAEEAGSDAGFKPVGSNNKLLLEVINDFLYSFS